MKVYVCKAFTSSNTFYIAKIIKNEKDAKSWVKKDEGWREYEEIEIED